MLQPTKRVDYALRRRLRLSPMQRGRDITDLLVLEETHKELFAYYLLLVRNKYFVITGISNE